jgi:hypothetical protein
VPSDAEWKTLIDFLGGEKAAQGKLKEAGTTHWHSPNTDATNESGFTALPGGNRFNNEPFMGLGDFTHWWTATEYDAKLAWRRTLWKNAPMDNTGGYADKKIGWLVRCVRDAAASLSASVAAQESTKPTNDYLGQAPPGDIPVVFAPGLISKNGLLDGGPYFTPDGNEVAWRENRKTGPDNKGWLFFSWNMRRENGVWSAPYPAPSDGDILMLFSADGQRVYFSSSRSGVRDIWVADRNGKDWGEPKCLKIVSRWPHLKFAWVESIAHNGTLYFTGHAPGLFHDSGIYRAELVNSEYTKPKLLPRNINLPPFLNWTPFIAPDEGYLLFSSTRTGSHGWRADLFISFRNADGSWTDPVGLGEAINTEEQERYPVVSPDGKYLFFTRGDGAVHNVYWVDASVIEPLRLQARGWTNLTGDYLGQKPPGATPEVFARGIVSTDDKEHSTPAFSPDGDEVFWREARPPGPNNSEWLAWGITMRRENGRWSAPHLSPYPNISVFSVDGKRQYFGAPRPGATHEDPPLDIWVTERQGDGWSAPKCLNLISQSPELQFAAWPTVARNGNLYFISSVPEQRNSGIARAEFINGQYAKPELLPKNINMAPYRNWAPFIAPDESYLLFSSNRPGSLDNEGDLYISRPLGDGKWSDPVRLGAPINTEYQERFSGLSPDGKYFFFTRWSPEHDEDVYWVDAASVPELRSNTVPSQEKTK